MLALALGALLLGACSPAPVPGKISVKWKLGYGVDCSKAGIDTIRVTVQERGERELVAETFSCSAGQATIADLPAGTFNLLVEGGIRSSFEYPVFTGTVGGVVVREGETIDVGEVTLEKLPPQQNPGGLEIEWTFNSGLCGANGVANVRLTVWRELVYKEHSNVYPCDLPAGRVKLDVSPGKYGIIAEGLDADGQLVRRAALEDVEVKQGETTTLTGRDSLVLAPL